MRMIYVDDEQFALDKLDRLLGKVVPEAERHGFLRAQEAMDFAAENAIDIALLDINMRVLDGVTMAKRLQALYPCVNVIFCTGYAEYMPDAFAMYCSGYLMKPITEEDLRTALKKLRYPVPEHKKRVELRCFGNFDVLCDGKPVAFKYKKTRELLAYLTDRDGAEATTQEIMAAIFEESKPSYFGNIRLDLLDTLAALGVPEVVFAAYGRMRVVRDQVTCDYFDFLDGKNAAFRGEYMSQYSFAEATCAALNERKK